MGSREERGKRRKEKGGGSDGSRVGLPDKNLALT
jgi:hypothetical protein